MLDLETIERDRAALCARWIREGYYRNRTVGQTLDAAARSHGDSALHFYSEFDARHTTVREINEAGRKMAGALHAIGLRAGDTVAVQLPTWYETAVLYAAVFHLGATLIPIVHIYGPHELEFILRSSRARCLVIPDRWRGVDYLERFHKIPALPDLDRVIVLGERCPEGAIAWSALCEQANDRFPDPQSNPDDVCLLLYTSGTTSNPKGVQQTHNTLTAEWHIPFIATHGPFLSPFPAGHIAGFNFVLRPMVCGVPMVLMDRWDASLAAQLIERHRVTQSGGTPFFLLSLLEANARDRRDLSSLRSFSVGGTSVTPEHVRLTDDAGFPGGRAYGLTEHSTVTHSDESMPFEKRAYTDGKVNVGSEVRIVDDAGNDVAPGADGEVATRAPELFVGYTDPELNRHCFLPGGWFLTGDIGRLDAEGYLTITDRKKDIIIRGGENISSKEVEDLLARHPAVAESAVVGMPDARYGEKVCAFVISKPGAHIDLADVQRHFEALGAARQKTPEKVVVVTELPRTPAGKIKKVDLRRLLAAGNP